MAKKKVRFHKPALENLQIQPDLYY